MNGKDGMPQIGKKSNPVVELSGERSYLSKESRPQGVAAERSPISFAFTARWGARVRSPHDETVQNATLGECLVWTGFQLLQVNKVFWQNIWRFRGKISNIITSPDAWAGKYHHCSRNLPSCQNSDDCRLRWNPTWNAQSVESIELTRVSSSLVFWKGTERLVNWGDHYLAQVRQERMH